MSENAGSPDESLRERRAGARSVRGALAVASGRLARKASRVLGRGSGGMIGGTVALAAHPQILGELAQGRLSALVTGTNGKSTTTRMLRAALATKGPVASNIRGDNMPPGIVTALMNDPLSDFAALEVDEMHLPMVAAQVKPQVMLLLNLSRDQLDRVGEIGAVEHRLRQAVNENPQARIIANCDDPLVVSAAWDAPLVTWVAAGSGWGADSASFPRGGGRVLRDGDDWWVQGGQEIRRPSPDWWVEGRETPELVNRDGLRLPLSLSIPGRVNLANAAQAVAGAVALGIPAQAAVDALASVSEVAGRYQSYDVNGRIAHLLLAKNPAGWQEALSMLNPEADQVVIAVNGQIPDGEDLSWLWDVDFESLRALAPGRLYAAGERGADLAVRLEYAGLSPVLVKNPLSAIVDCAAGPVEVLANYTSFRDLLSELRADGFVETKETQR